MLHIIKNFRQLDFRKLMDIYAQSNLENARERYPELPDGLAVLQAEQDFYDYLRDVFFKTQGAYYALWEDQGRYVSALRLEPYKDGVLLEALETAPDSRGRGYAQSLVKAVLPLENKIYSHVGKKNNPSLAVHEKCGFQRISQRAVYIDGSVNDKCCTLCFSGNHLE